MFYSYALKASQYDVKSSTSVPETSQIHLKERTGAETFKFPRQRRFFQVDCFSKSSPIREEHGNNGHRKSEQCVSGTEDGKCFYHYLFHRPWWLRVCACVCVCVCVCLKGRLYLEVTIGKLKTARKRLNHFEWWFYRYATFQKTTHFAL